MSKLGIGALCLLATLATPALAHDRDDAGTSDLTASDVRSAQHTLDDLGYPVGRADGVLGARSRTAIRNFQRDKGLNATGRLDPDTLAALDAASRRGERAETTERGEHARNENPRHESPRYESPRYESGTPMATAAVRRAQTKLDKLGYPVDSDGRLGAATRTAIRNFQRDRGLNATGELDDETMSALDSDTGSSTSSRTRPR